MTSGYGRAGPRTSPGAAIRRTWTSTLGQQTDLADDLPQGVELLSFGQPGDGVDHRLGGAVGTQVGEQACPVGGEHARRQVPGQRGPARHDGGSHAARWRPGTLRGRVAASRPALSAVADAVPAQALGLLVKVVVADRTLLVALAVHRPHLSRSPLRRPCTLSLRIDLLRAAAAG